MKLREKQIIHSEPQAVWEALTDLELWPAWNDRIAKVELLGGISQVKSGANFKAQLSWKERDFFVVGRVERCEAPAEFECSYRAQEPESLEIETIDRYEVRPHLKGTLLKRTVTVKNSGVPLWAQFLISIIQRFGTPVESTVLEEFEDYLEERECTLQL